MKSPRVVGADDRRGALVCKRLFLDAKDSPNEKVECMALAVTLAKRRDKCYNREW